MASGSDQRQKIVEARYRWLVIQEMGLLRGAVEDAMVDDNLDAIYDSIRRLLWKLDQENRLGEIRTTRLLIETALEAIKGQLLEKTPGDGEANGEDRH